MEHIISYCDQIEQTVIRFGDDYQTFAKDPIYRNASALCILQIGELVGKLTDEFRVQHPGVPWRQIKAMRNGRVWRIPKTAVQEYIVKAAGIRTP